MLARCILYQRRQKFQLHFHEGGFIITDSFLQQYSDFPGSPSTAGVLASTENCYGLIAMQLITYDKREPRDDRKCTQQFLAVVRE